MKDNSYLKDIKKKDDYLCVNRVKVLTAWKCLMMWNSVEQYLFDTFESNEQQFIVH